ncbi:MAG: bL17 family ribosomal protein, partial [Desulfobacterales bacterium]|nr:bL17 family ribosomal protein [Desulfobacterales bacterium]
RLFGDLKDRYLERQGGYVRIIKKGVRKGDGAAISVIQLLPIEEGKKLGKRKVKKSKTKKASPDKAGDITAGKEKKGESKPKREKAAKKEEKK